MSDTLATKQDGKDVFCCPHCGQPIPLRFRSRYFPEHVKIRVLELLKQGRDWYEIEKSLIGEFPKQKTPDARLIYKWRRRWMDAGHLPKDSLPFNPIKVGRPTTPVRDDTDTRETKEYSAKVSRDEEVYNCRLAAFPDGIFKEACHQRQRELARQARKGDFTARNRLKPCLECDHSIRVDR